MHVGRCPDRHRHLWAIHGGFHGPFGCPFLSPRLGRCARLARFSASRSRRKIRKKRGRMRCLGFRDGQEAINEIGHHFERLTLLFDHSDSHVVCGPNIPVAVESQHCRQWFAQIAVSSRQQGPPGAVDGFGSITRSSQCDGEPFRACQIVLTSFAGASVSPRCPGSQSFACRRPGG